MAKLRTRDFLATRLVPGWPLFLYLFVIAASAGVIAVLIAAGIFLASETGNLDVQRQLVDAGLGLASVGVGFAGFALAAGGLERRNIKARSWTLSAASALLGGVIALTALWHVQQVDLSINDDPVAWAVPAFVLAAVLAVLGYYLVRFAVRTYN